MKNTHKELPEELDKYKEFSPKENIETKNEKSLAPLAFTLVVKSPFRNYKIGDHIFNLEEMEIILNCHEHSMVIKSANQLRK